MLKFIDGPYRNLVAATDGWSFEIVQSRSAAFRGEKSFWVMVRKKSVKGFQNLSTERYQKFETVEDAKMFCEDLLAGKVTLEEIEAQIEAKAVIREQEAIQAATERARKFRGKLETLNISYTALLELMDEQMELGERAHRLLLKYEEGKMPK